MSPETRQAHVLSGLPEAATQFVSALEANRRRIAADAGLTATELRALFHIGQVVSLTPKELAIYLDVTTGAVTSISRGLVDAGLVHRVDHPGDRRSLYLELTPKGHRVMTEIHDTFDAMVAESSADLDEATIAQFTTALRLVATEVRRRLQA